MTPDARGFRLDGADLDLGGRRVLQGISLALAPGRVCGVIGRNGSGKSSLLRLTGRQTRAAPGRIRLDGRPLEDWPAREFARRVAMMPQSAPATEAMILADLVALGRYPWHGALRPVSDADRNAVREAIALCGLETLAGRPLHSLSGGEAQRARLAMMLAQGAEWLLLDEPSASLDLAWSLELMRQLRDLAHRAGKGVMIALHDMNLAARFCDDLVALEGGRICGAGPVAEVFRPDILSATFGLPVEVTHLRGLPVALAAPDP